ncbi:MAG: GNAT family N-acetyltransferase [Alphaproteobacteria bacterium]|nr:GNAT family N-acetyltransferase [Alphaproteobacteria bacterium]
MLFEHLNPKKHDRKSFDCGVEALNLYLQRGANQDQRRSLTKTYVLVEGERVIGYYSISAHSILRDNLPDDIKLASYKEVPFLLLGRLAVDKEFQGQGYGDALIFHAFKITLDAAEKVGILGMVVDAKDKKAVSFYEGFGFKRLTGSEKRLVLPLSIMDSLTKA